MTDYIKRTDAVKIAEKYGLANGSALGRHTGLADCIASEILSLPAADVAPVVHGKWGDNGIAGSMRSELGERIFQEIGEDGVLEQLASALYYMSSTVQLMKCPRSRKEKLRPMLADEWADVLMSAGVLGIEPNPDACGGKLISWAKAIGIEVGDEGIKGPPGALGVDPRGERGT